MPVISINIQNNGNAATDFMYFLAPANTLNDRPVYTASLGTVRVAPYDQSGAIVTLEIDFQCQAGVQQAHNPPVAGQQSGFASACRAISLSTANKPAPNATTMILSPLGLSDPTAVPDVPQGSFRISMPSYDSKSLTYYAGTGLRTKSGGVVLPNFVMAGPNLAIDCRPVTSFLVAAGSAKTGIVINPSAYARVATCNTAQYTAFLVIYDSQGEFSVTGFSDDVQFLSSAKAISLRKPAPLHRIFVPL